MLCSFAFGNLFGVACISPRARKKKGPALSTEVASALLKRGFAIDPPCHGIETEILVFRTNGQLREILKGVRRNFLQGSS